MVRKSFKPAAAILVLSIVVYQPSVYAASVVSKTAAVQTLGARAADLAGARVLLGTDSTRNALAAAGLAQEQIQIWMAALTTSDLILLAQHPAQIKTAGVTMSKKVWTMVGLAAGAVAVGAFALQQKDDGEDEDGSDDGED